MKSMCVNAVHHVGVTSEAVMTCVCGGTFAIPSKLALTLTLAHPTHSPSVKCNLRAVGPACFDVGGAQVRHMPLSSAGVPDPSQERGRVWSHRYTRVVQMSRMWT